MMGSSLTRLGLPLIAALTLNATTAQMGYLTALESAPYLLLGLFAGVLVDRFSRRALMIAGDLGRAVLFSIVPAAALLGWLSMPLLYSVTFLAGILTVIFQVASQSYVPDLITRDKLVEGNSRLELSSALTSVAGPSLAGVIIQAVTAPFAILLDAFSFLFSGASILLIRHREKPVPNKVEPLLRQVREGMSAVLKNPFLRAFAGCLATSNLASMAFFALYILFGTRELGMEPAALGLVYGIGASGAIAGSIAAPRLAARAGRGAHCCWERCWDHGGAAGGFCHTCQRHPPVDLIQPAGQLWVGDVFCQRRQRTPNHHPACAAWARELDHGFH